MTTSFIAELVPTPTARFALNTLVGLTSDPFVLRGGTMTEQPRAFDYPVRKAKSCPVCGQSSYSKDGIHPQCAVQLADESRKEKLQAARKASQTGEPKQKSWNKQCPQCKTQLHVRRKECDCGHVFRQTKSSANS